MLWIALNHFEKFAMKKIFILSSCVVTIGVLFAIGCGTSRSVSKEESEPQMDGSGYLLAGLPEGALDVKAAREVVEDQEAVVIVGRIGGAVNPWVDKRAAFQIVDSSLPACSDCKDGEACSCKTPWDYCCETDKLPTAMALVQFTDSNGKVIRHDARDLFDLTELQTVVVRGVAKRDDAGNLTIMADGLFVN